MDFKSWYQKRGPKFIWQRGRKLLERYGIGPGKAMERINGLTKVLADLGCPPTFFTPGIILKRYPLFIKQLSELGAEIAVHSYHHVNLSQLPVAMAQQQLERATQTFKHFGVERYGLRCPYLGYSDELIDAIPDGMFNYSSNEAIHWDVIDKNTLSHRGIFFNSLEKFYQAKDSSQNLCLPSIRSNMVEIPVCVPDDLQIYDGLSADDDITHAWIQFLEQTYCRGELFTLLFHTELAYAYARPFTELIHHSRCNEPQVWIATLRDICDWWQEKSQFNVEISKNSDSLTLTFDCSPRATILAKNLEIAGTGSIWDRHYYRLNTKTMVVPASPRPFIGLTGTIPDHAVSLLHENGYILDSGETARECGIVLSENTLSTLSNDLELINYIEASHAPVVRFGRWPDGAKSAMSLTGDLDALSLIDYASRLLQ